MIPIIIGIILFTMPWWYFFLIFNSNKNFEKETKKQHQNTSLVDYSIPYNLKIRYIKVFDLGMKENPSGLDTLPGKGNISYHPNNLDEAVRLLDALKDRKIQLYIELTLNTLKDTLNQQAKMQLRQKTIDLIEYQDIKKATGVEILVFKETDYTIQQEIEYPIGKDDEYAVLLTRIEVKNGKIATDE